MKSLLILAASLTLAGPAAAKGTGAVKVMSPWSRPAVAGSNGVGYMVLANPGRAADALTRVESPIASRVDMHSSTMAGGVMSMQQEDRVAVPAGGQTTFGPGAYHLMFMGLTRTLKPGDAIPATLTFSSGAKVKARFAVSAGMGPPAMSGMAH